MEERDLHYAGVLGSRKLQVSGLEITVEEAGETPGRRRERRDDPAIYQADAFETELQSISLDAIGKGFSCTEIIWDTSEKQWQPSALKWRDPALVPICRRGWRDAIAARSGTATSCSRRSNGSFTRRRLNLACRSVVVSRGRLLDFPVQELCGQRLGNLLRGLRPAASPRKVLDQAPARRTRPILLQAVADIGVDYSAIVPASMAVGVRQGRYLRLTRALRKALGLARSAGFEIGPRPNRHHGYERFQRLCPGEGPRRRQGGHRAVGCQATRRGLRSIATWSSLTSISTRGRRRSIR